MKYQVEITYKEVIAVEADSSEEARELAINGFGTVIRETEVEDIEIRKVM